MPSDGESEVFERDTQFVYKSGDEDVLWEVKEITAERGNKYKVRWAGVDPATGKAWPQSWVPKHDCTDDLVVAWKLRKRGRGGRRGRRSSAASKGGSRRTGSSTGTGEGTRREASGATSSRLESVREHVSVESSPPPPSPPPKPSTRKKRKRQSTPKPVAVRAEEEEEEEEAAEGEGDHGGDERPQPEPEERPHKKRRTLVEVLLPPLSSEDEDEADDGHVEGKEASRKNNEDDAGESSPPKTKTKSGRRSGTRSKAAVIGARTPAMRPPPSKTKTKDVVRRKARVTEVISLDESDDEDEALRPPRSKKKSMPVCESPSEEKNKEPESPPPPIKIGPPRGVKRQQKKSGLPEPGPSRIKPSKDDDPIEQAAPESSVHRPSSLDSPQLLQGEDVTRRTSPPRQISIPPVPQAIRPQTPDLSPGAKARLQLFDRMMTVSKAPSPSCVAERIADDLNRDEAHDNNVLSFDAFEDFELPPPLSPPPVEAQSKRPKQATPNGLVVPESESSGNSQGQSQPLANPPSSPPRSPAREPPPRKAVDLPSIAVIDASANSPTPPDLVPPQKPPAPVNRPPKKLKFPGPNAFRATINAPSRVADLEPPLSSIESFTSPQRKNKGKQKAVDNDPPQSSLSDVEAERDDAPKKGRKKVTDSELRKRGKELFDQAQLAREAAWLKNKKPKRLKRIGDIINGAVPSSSTASPLSLVNGVDSGPELRVEDVTTGANSTTLDTQEHSEAKPLSEEERERLRIALRQEEEESTQEAMGIYPPEPELIHNDDLPMSSPKSPKGSEPIVDDRVEQPSTELLLASVIVQASQGQGQEDTDMDVVQDNRLTSSPARPVPERLSDSPKRRLGEALSLLNVKSEEIQRLERELAEERENLGGLKSKLAELEQSSEPTGPVRAAWEAERAQWSQERTQWEKDSSAWEAQRKETSQEQERLAARLAELSEAAARAEKVEVRLSELEAERDAWTKERDVMLHDTTQRSEELVALAQVRGECDQDRSKWEAEKIAWSEAKARWETERAALQQTQETLSRSVDELTASVESIKAANASAEKDRDFFREQYAQASAFVGSIRDENAELETRTKIAEGQAREGVAAIKALFEGRIKTLQADVDRWKALTDLLQEKDRRTNDELRLRAAQTPELVELCDRLSTQNKSLEVDVQKLSQTQQRRVHQRNKLFYEIFLLKRERASLRSKLSKRTKTLENGTGTQKTHESAPETPIPEDPDNIDPNDMEILPEATSQSPDTTFDEPALFPCMWRPEWRDQCQQIFDTKEDLERHMQEHFRDLVVQ